MKKLQILSPIWLLSLVLSLFSFLSLAPSAQAAASLLQPSDFTYLGYYDVQTDGNSAYGQGLTYRYVNGDLRFLTLDLDGKMDEFSIAGKNYGDKITQATNSWNIPSAGGRGHFSGIWWDATNNRLWTADGIDYIASYVPTQIFTYNLNSDGTTSNMHGPLSLDGISDKRAYGGVQPVPSWFQQQYGVGPYVVGFGGYTSLVVQGGGASMGLTMYAIPDINNYGNNTSLPVGTFKTIADHALGNASTESDWYKLGAPNNTTGDRGRRITNPVNFLDGNDPRQNPPTRPSGSPPAGSVWLSPAPDNYGRWVWGDSYYGTGMWIDTPTKQGFVTIGSFCGGDCWYQSGTLAFDSRQFELHIFDPATLGAAATGQIQPWQVQPASMTQLNLPLGNNKVNYGDIPKGNIAGAAFDPTTGRMYLMGEALGPDDSTNRLYVYQVNTSSSGNPPPSLVGDLNNDHIVNSLDWSIMNSKWFTNDATADLNHDGIVNAIDFSLLNANWFKTN